MIRIVTPEFAQIIEHLAFFIPIAGIGASDKSQAAGCCYDSGWGT
jgi:hypothetical protein